MMKVLDHLEEWLITFLMGAATVIIFVAVVHRYLSGYDIPVLQDWLLGLNFGWTQEACIYMFVWMAKFGAAYGVRTGIHVGVDVLINRLADRNRARFILFGLMAGALFTGIVGTLGATFVWENGAHYAIYSRLGWDVGDVPEGPTTPDLEWPTWVIYLAVPLGSYLMCFRFLQVAVAFWRTGELPHHDHGHVEGLEKEVEGKVIVPGAEDKVFTVSEGLHPRDLRQPPYDDGLPGSLRKDDGAGTDDKKDGNGGERK